MVRLCGTVVTFESTFGGKFRPRLNELVCPGRYFGFRRQILLIKVTSGDRDLTVERKVGEQ